ncbi:MAG: DUF6265 family protein [Planctomycetes bacterium]|nr:DUF6265 family protein [Planctomycetota bacterium]
MTRTAVLFTAALVVCMHSGVAAAPPEGGVAALGWLEGRWRGPGGRGQTFEAIYTSPEGGVILGVTKGFSGDRVTFTEFERIEARGGEVVLTPFPGGREACTFTLTEHDAAARRAVFANPDNDFPARIVFERPEDGALRITLEGAPGGTPRVMVLDLRRG